MTEQPIFSIGIPTYNSGSTLQYTLDSIMQQDFDKNKIEILILDGGSSDNTLNIAQQYNGVKILKNDKRLPEFAKLMAINVATGKYYISMDSDESFAHHNVLSQRLLAFEKYPEANLLVADKLIYIKGFGLSGNYLNVCGDPFTWFIYRNKHGVLDTFKKNISQQWHTEQAEINLLTFSTNDKRPIADGGTTTYSLDFIKQNYPNKVFDIKFATTVSENILNINHNCLCVKNDNIFHRSKSQLKTYLKKIRFRIINNVFSPNESGFSSRNICQNNKKYLFPLYTASFVMPLFDSIKLTIKYKDLSMMLHIFYAYYTTVLILYYMGLKTFGVKIKNKEY